MAASVQLLMAVETRLLHLAECAASTDELMVANGVHQLPVVRDGALVGMLSRSDVMRSMQLGAELNLRGSAGSNEAPAESRVARSRG